MNSEKLKTDIDCKMIIIIILLCFSVCNQGGYFQGAVIAVGLTEIMVCVFTKIKFNAYKAFELLFCIWYFLCSVKNGLVFEYAVKGMLPAVVLMFDAVIPKNNEKSDVIITVILNISVFISAIAVVHCILITLKSGTFQRLLFPFQYSNACGIYFGVMLVLSEGRNNKLMRNGRWLFCIALLLTLSVGAIVLTLIAAIALDKNRKRRLAVILFAAVFSVCFHQRIYESLWTFAERLLQMQDGIICTLRNPLFGIGAGRWEALKYEYQSGFYNAKVIHSSVIQIGVNSGIPGLIMFIVIMVFRFRKNCLQKTKRLLCACMIIMHSCFDFSLSFMGIDMLLILFLSSSEAEEQYVKYKYKILPLILGLVIFITSAVGMYKIKFLNNMLNSKSFSKCVDYYEKSWFLRYSDKAKTDYINALYMSGKLSMAEKEIDSIKYPSADMIILKVSCCENQEVILKKLTQQPYNISIYKGVYSFADEEIKERADEILQCAVSSMSQLGKVLYEKKGLDF